MLWPTIFRFCVKVAILIALENLLRSINQSHLTVDVDEEQQESQQLSDDHRIQLNRIARTLVDYGKGILAADESIATMGKRFSEVAVENSAENRRKYREMLFTAPNISNYISGIILHEETFDQKSTDGRLLVDIARNAGVLVGIKLDLGLVSLNGTSETTTHGLESLLERSVQFQKRGAQFAKWRCVLYASRDTPTHLALLENARVLARFAKIVQRAGLVAIVEPEVVCVDDCNLQRIRHVTEETLNHVYRALKSEQVYMYGTLLKPNMVTSSMKNDSIKIANATIEVLIKTVPDQIPGIVFLSGGQSEDDATTNLCAINKMIRKPRWKLSFSFGRALQKSALRAWKRNGTYAGQRAFINRARLNSLATLRICTIE